ncbi:hypothetical protein PTI98_004268 [Pleurotus ostreatus]|nr:hypothetical protein PTI98_004268 [Pleurotus ostreatus]
MIPSTLAFVVLAASSVLAHPTLSVDYSQKDTDYTRELDLMSRDLETVTSFYNLVNARGYVDKLDEHERRSYDELQGRNYDDIQERDILEDFSRLMARAGGRGGGGRGGGGRGGGGRGGGGRGGGGGGGGGVPGLKAIPPGGIPKPVPKGAPKSPGQVSKPGGPAQQPTKPKAPPKQPASLPKGKPNSLSPAGAPTLKIDPNTVIENVPKVVEPAVEWWTQQQQQQ